jgi:hypothetical protein
MFRWLWNTPSNHPNAGKMGACLGGIAAMAPLMFLEHTGPVMTRTENVISLVLMALGLILGFLLGVRRPVLGLVVVPLCVFAVSFGTSWFLLVHLRSAKLAPLRGHLHEYTDLAIDPEGPGAEKGAIVRRKMVVIDRQKKDIDPLQHLLPDDLQADGPEEVRTVVWLEWGAKQVGVYPRGGKPFQRFVDVSVIDLGQPPKLLIRKRFYGSPPPQQGESDDRYGGAPLQDIISFLRSTPDR